MFNTYASLTVACGSGGTLLRRGGRVGGLLLRGQKGGEMGRKERGRGYPPKVKLSI